MARLTVVTITRHTICIYTILNVGVSRAGCIGTMKSHFVEISCSLDVRYLLSSNDRFVATYTGERSNRDLNLNIARRRVFSWDFEYSNLRTSTKHRNNRGKPETFWTIAFGTIVRSYFEPPSIENTFCIVFERIKTESKRVRSDMTFRRGNKTLSYVRNRCWVSKTPIVVCRALLLKR